MHSGVRGFNIFLGRRRARALEITFFIRKFRSSTAPKRRDFRVSTLTSTHRTGRRGESTMSRQSMLSCGVENAAPRGKHHATTRLLPAPKSKAMASPAVRQGEKRRRARNFNSRRAEAAHFSCHPRRKSCGIKRNTCAQKSAMKSSYSWRRNARPAGVLCRYHQAAGDQRYKIYLAGSSAPASASTRLQHAPSFTHKGCLPSNRRRGKFSPS